jgi:hypothetical protein
MRSSISYRSVISSTFSHLSPRSKIKRSAFKAWRHECARSNSEDSNDVEKYLVEKTKKRPFIAADAEIVGEEAKKEKDKEGQLIDVVHLVIEHQPCPKFRVVAPLAEPWRPNGYQDNKTACADWADALVRGGEELLGLVVDHACSDPSRLFYTPRRPTDGPEPETAHVKGAPIRFEELAAAAERSKARKSEAIGSSEFDFNTAGSQFSAPKEHIIFTDTTNGQEVDLTRWAAKYGDRFKIIDALRARSGGVLMGISATSGEHIQCPRSDWHNSPSNEREAFAWNAGDGESRGFGIFCQHDGCKIGTRGIDRLSHLEQMLTLGWLKIEDLTDDRFLLLEPEVDNAFSGTPSPIGLPVLTGDPPPPPPVLVPGMIPMTVHSIVAPGGTAKTTIVLLCMIRLITGRTVLGKGWPSPVTSSAGAKVL